MSPSVAEKGASTSSITVSGHKLPSRHLWTFSPLSLPFFLSPNARKSKRGGTLSAKPFFLWRFSFFHALLLLLCAPCPSKKIRGCPPPATEHTFFLYDGGVAFSFLGWSFSFTPYLSWDFYEDEGNPPLPGLLLFTGPPPFPISRRIVPVVAFEGVFFYFFPWSSTLVNRSTVFFFRLGTIHPLPKTPPRKGPASFGLPPV